MAGCLAALIKSKTWSEIMNAFIDMETVSIANRLKEAHYPFPRAQELRTQFNSCLEDYYAKAMSGKPFEARGLLVTGKSRMGNARRIERIEERPEGALAFHHGIRRSGGGAAGVIEHAGPFQDTADGDFGAGGRGDRAVDGGAISDDKDASEAGFAEAIDVRTQAVLPGIPDVGAVERA